VGNQILNDCGTVRKSRTGVGVKYSSHKKGREGEGGRRVLPSQAPREKTGPALDTIGSISPPEPHGLLKLDGDETWKVDSVASSRGEESLVHRRVTMSILWQNRVKLGRISGLSANRSSLHCGRNSTPIYLRKGGGEGAVCILLVRKDHKEGGETSIGEHQQG